MQNIGIITLSASNNCGSLLQSYALKSLLEKYGKVEVINFSSIGSHIQYDIFPPNMKFYRRYRKIPYFRDLKNEQKGYMNFRKEYLGIDGPELFSEDLYGIKDKYDYVVMGSDQIWNVRMGDFDDAFFVAGRMH